jgi:hypothetical protein
MIATFVSLSLQLSQPALACAPMCRRLVGTIVPAVEVKEDEGALVGGLVISQKPMALLDVAFRLIPTCPRDVRSSG